MSMLKFTSFGGEVPRLTKRQLPDDKAQVAENLLADTSEFRPLHTDLDPGITLSGFTPGTHCQTLYRYPTNTDTPIGTPLKVSFVRSPIAKDQYDRVYAATLGDEPSSLPPMVLSTGGSGGPVPGSSLRPLGVKFPVNPLTLSVATVDETFLTPSEAVNFERSVLDEMARIVATALTTELWNPAFNLTGMPAFREDPYDTGKGVYQRMYVLTNPTEPVWVWATLNGTPVDNHLWITEVSNAPYKTEGSNRVYYANFNAKVWVWRIAADVSAQTTALKALKLPGTTTSILSDAEITALWAYVRGILPDTPTDTSNPDLKTLLARYQSEYRTLVGFLDQGFPGDITPQMGYNQMIKAFGDLTSTVDGITSFYERQARVDFNSAVLNYFNAKVAGNLPTGESILTEPRYYTFTFVNDRGEESKPYTPGTGEDLPYIEVNQAQNVTVTLPANAVSNAGAGANDFITKWRVYRSATGTSQAAFLFVTELAVGTTTFVDERKTDALNEPLATTTWEPPPTSGGAYLKHLVGLPGGFMAGFIGNTVYFSEPYHPYAWPPEYAIPLQGDVVALGVFGVTLVAFTKRGPVYISGGSPDALSTVVLENNDVCQSPRSVVPVAGGVLFASQNGLCLASQDGVRVLTEALMTKAEWQSHEPHNFICEEMNGVVYMTHSAGALTAALHIPTMKLVRMDLSVKAFYSDYHNGELYAAPPTQSGQSPKVIKLLSGTSVRTARWLSKRIVLEKQTGFAWLAVEGEQTVDTPLNVDIWGYTDDGTQVKIMTATGTSTYSAVVTDTQPIRVEAGRFKDFEVEIQGKCRVSSVLLASSTAELQGVN